jgi:hypothetical protein
MKSTTTGHALSRRKFRVGERASDAQAADGGDAGENRRDAIIRPNAISMTPIISQRSRAWSSHAIHDTSWSLPNSLRSN